MNPYLQVTSFYNIESKKICLYLGLLCYCLPYLNFPHPLPIQWHLPYLILFLPHHANTPTTPIPTIDGSSTHPMERKI